jgi:MFS family permease
LFSFLFASTESLGQMWLIAAGYGLSLGCVWAPIMGWLSGNAEGVTLNRRLGLFNITWSTNVLISPMVAGYLLKQSLELPFAVIAVVMALGSLNVLLTSYKAARRPERSERQDTADKHRAAAVQESAAMDSFKVRYIRYLAWAAAVTGFTAFGVYLYQMPHLATAIKMDKVVFGALMSTLSASRTLAFFLTARWTGWHGRTRWIFVPQATLAAIAILLTFAQSAWLMAPLMVFAGLAVGMVYMNSIFYGSTGAAPAVRTRRMAIHEVCLNTGMITGAFVGNHLSEALGPSRVYPYLAGTIAVAALAQVVAWNLLQARDMRRSQLGGLGRGFPVSLNPAGEPQE